MFTTGNLVLPALGNLPLVINVNLSRSTPRRHRRRRGMAPLFLNLDSRQRRLVSFNDGSFMPAEEPVRSRPGPSTFRDSNHIFEPVASSVYRLLYCAFPRMMAIGRKILPPSSWWKSSFGACCNNWEEVTCLVCTVLRQF